MTEQSESIAKLSEALSKAQGKFDHAKKDVKNEFFKSKYADLASVIDAAKDALSENGLAVIQTTKVNPEGKVTLITTLSHSSGEWIKGEYPISPVKQDPQGMGSALTYARRYCFSSITGIASDDDDGNSASGNSSGTQAKEPKSSFSNASLRKTYCDNVIKSFDACETLVQLDEIKELNKLKFGDMRISGNEHDLMAVEELVKRYKLREKQIKENDNFEQLQEDFKERK